MKYLLLVALLLVGCGASSGGDAATADAPNPHDTVSCMMGSATLCENACLMSPASDNIPCGANYGTLGGQCPMTFKDSDGKRGCCIIDDSPGQGPALRFIECN